jgi:hypothetical protein
MGPSCSSFLLFLHFIFFGSTRFELGLMLAKQVHYCLSHFNQPFFVLGIFEMGSCKLFAGGWLQIAILLISAS